MRRGSHSPAGWCIRAVASDNQVTTNRKDREIWNKLFSNVPPEWRTAPPSQAMVECREFVAREHARSVLDVGCGVGRWSIFFGKAGLTVKGSDFAENGVKYATEWAREEDVDVEFTCCPITQIPFPGEEFDAVVAAMVLDNLSREEMKLAIRCIDSSLKAGGVVFALFNPKLSEDELEKLSRTDNPTKGVTLILYDDDELREAFVGFEVMDLRRYEMGTRGLYLRKLTRQRTRA